jgi:hypothetical protein
MPRTPTGRGRTCGQATQDRRRMSCGCGMVAVRAGTRGRLRATRQPAAHSDGTGGRALLTGDQTISTAGGASMAGHRCRLTGCLSLGVQSSIIPSRTGEVRPAGGVIPSRQAARANRARSFRRRTEQPSRPSWARPDAGMPLHQTMSHSPAAVAAPSVIGGAGADFIQQLFPQQASI